MNKILCFVVQLFLTQSLKHLEALSGFMFFIFMTLNNMIILLFHNLLSLDVYWLPNTKGENKFHLTLISLFS